MHERAADSDARSCVVLRSTRKSHPESDNCFCFSSRLMLDLRDARRAQPRERAAGPPERLVVSGGRPRQGIYVDGNVKRRMCVGLALLWVCTGLAGCGSSSDSSHVVSLTI